LKKRYKTGDKTFKTVPGKRCSLTGLPNPFKPNRFQKKPPKHRPKNRSTSVD